MMEVAVAHSQLLTPEEERNEAMCLVLSLKLNFVFYLPDIPILPTVSAKITFQEFAFRDDIPDSHFEVPLGYAEDPNR